MGNTIFIQEKRVCVRPLHSRLEAIQKLRLPTTAKGCRSFAKMVNFLSIFCQDLQKLLKPIYDMTRKDRSFNWGHEQQTAFDETKSRLQKPHVLLCKAVLASIQFALDFFKCLGVFALYFFICCTELTQLCSSSGSLFFAHLGGIRGDEHAVITLTLT